MNTDDITYEQIRQLTRELEDNPDPENTIRYILSQLENKMIKIENKNQRIEEANKAHQEYILSINQSWFSKLFRTN